MRESRHMSRPTLETRIMKTWLHAAALSALAMSLTGCGKPQPVPEPPAPVPEAATPAPVSLPRSTAPVGARVTITSPADGAAVKSPVTVTFAIEGMTLAPAGVNDPGTGHHHLLVDAGMPAPDQPIPKDANHIHYGQGQADAQVALSPGRHTLQLLLGDGNHVPHDPPVASEIVTIMVE
jgi:hypothetical protein